jgi:hypothetical protein
MNNERGFELWVGSIMISEVHFVESACVRFILNTHGSSTIQQRIHAYLVAKHYLQQKTLQFKESGPKQVRVNRDHPDLE